MERILLLEVTISMTVPAQKILIPRGTPKTSCNVYANLVFFKSTAIFTLQPIGGAGPARQETTARIT
jgi:hypothetical protein